MVLPATTDALALCHARARLYRVVAGGLAQHLHLPSSAPHPQLLEYRGEGIKRREATLVDHLRVDLLRCADATGNPWPAPAASTQRRYDHLWQRLGKHLPWVATQQVSTHRLRHTTLTWVERNFGYAVAWAYAGHSGRGNAGTTSTYIRADVSEVALAHSTLTTEPHPLAGTGAGGAAPIRT